MSRIQLLPEEVACQVAAGEVVERPASVVKELVENSLDAEAKKIEVRVRRGGISEISVVDDGIGMDRDDALLCLERHATSKIRRGADLMAISTLGFRGEALPSIASVSRFRLATRERGALVGTEVAVAGGKMEYVRDGGEAEGTRIEVRSLFYNLPARRKFLRTENTEANHVEQQMYLQAIGHPETGFVYINNERVVHQLPAVTNLADRIRDLSGRDLMDHLAEISAGEYGGLKIRGFLGKPGVSRSTRAQQIVFLNGRAIENGTLNYALREGYHTALMKGQYPITFLFLEIDPAAVDVNVHPAKREVRFRDSSMVREAVVECVRRTIESGRKEWSQSFQPSASGLVVPETVSPPERDLFPAPKGTEIFRRNWTPVPAPLKTENAELSDVPTATATSAAPSNGFSAPAEQGEEVEPAVETKPSQRFRILGVLGKLYVLMENESGLVLVDQHAAHERILFEQLRERMETQGVPTQRLLIPLTIHVTPKDREWVNQNILTLQKMGIGIEGFGNETFKIDALPQFFKTDNPQVLIRELIDELRDVSDQSSKLRLGEDVIATTVCRHAVKANDHLREPELVRLIEDLLKCKLPYCCPHGRPTMIQMSYDELEKKFGRKV